MLKNRSIQLGWYTGIVHLWDLPANKIYITLNDKFKYNLFKGIANLKEFSKIHKINYKTLLGYRYSNKQRISLKLIWKLLDVINDKKKIISKQDVENNTTIIGGHQSYIINPKLPFNFNNTHGAKFIASILHDGGIKKNHLIPFYSNFNVDKKKEVYNTINKIFGKIRDYDFSLDLIEYVNLIGISLVYGLGMKAGNKVLNNPSIPEFIFKLDKRSISAYLQQAYDDDGCVCKGKRKNNKMVSITCNTGNKLEPPFPNLLFGVKRLLKILNVNAQEIHKSKNKFIKKRGYLSQEWKINVTGLYSLKKFKRLINFNIDYKKEDLDFIIKHLEKSSIVLQKPNNLSKNQALEIIKRASEKGNYIDKNILASKMNFTSYWTKDLLRKLNNEGNIIKIEKFKWKSPDRYIYSGDLNE